MPHTRSGKPYSTVESAGDRSQSSSVTRDSRESSGDEEITGDPKHAHVGGESDNLGPDATNHTPDPDKPLESIETASTTIANPQAASAGHKDSPDVSKNSGGTGQGSVEGRTGNMESKSETPANEQWEGGDSTSSPEEEAAKGRKPAGKLWNA